jgi:hypothetical protein
MRTKLNSRPAKTARKHDAAWWYENARSIDVYIYVGGSGEDAKSCRISRADLLDWIRRTSPQNERKP